MSVITTDDTITITIEPEKTDNGTPKAEESNESDELKTDGNTNTTNINNNSEIVNNVSNKAFYSNPVDEIKIDPRVDQRSPFVGALNSDYVPPVSRSSEIRNNSQQDTCTHEMSPCVEVPKTEIRYFKGIGDPDTSENSGFSDLFFPKSALELVTTQFTQPSLGSSKEASAENSNESHFTTSNPLSYKDMRYGKVNLHAPDEGPRIYAVKGNIISKPIITRNLPEAFRAQPVYGKAENKASLDEFYEQKIRDYIGCGITDQEFTKHQQDLNPDHLRTGLEFVSPYYYPTQGSVYADLNSPPPENGPGQHLCTVKKLHVRKLKDTQNHYPRKLKYRGLRMLPLSVWDDVVIKESPESRLMGDGMEGALEPGRDLIFRARIYRPHSYGGKEKSSQSNRHSVFKNDLVILGRQRLTAMRDRFSCANDVGLRIDVSDNPDNFGSQSAKDMFPSGFLFINNVFYVDKRPGCHDLTQVIRDWARQRQIGEFPVRDMAAVRLDQLVLRLGHPEVYMHQGTCEHLFTFSEVRLLSPTDPLHVSCYPCYTQISQNQSVYCTTCAEFGAKWIVTGCTRVPFDPAFFCDTCFKCYLYDSNGKKIENFKAFSYKGNSVNFMRPTPGFSNMEENTGLNGNDYSAMYSSNC